MSTSADARVRTGVAARAPTVAVDAGRPAEALAAALAAHGINAGGGHFYAVRPLAAMGVGDLVDAACAATVIGAAKPDPRAYQIAAARLGVEPQECLFLDDEEACVAGARAVGMTAYRVDRTLQAHALDQGIVADLGVLPELLARLGR